MAEEAPTPPSLAMFDEGVARTSLEFKVRKDASSHFIATSEDDLYDYTASPGEFPLNGTLFIHDRKTGKLKPIPIQVLMEISRELKIGRDITYTTAGINELITNFGSHQAKRIQKMRQEAAQ